MTNNETYTTDEIRAAFTRATKDDWGVPSFYESSLLSVLRRMRLEATCAPDCRERTECYEIGTSGHTQCGICPTHNTPRHHCGGSVIDHNDTHDTHEEN